MPETMKTIPAIFDTLPRYESNPFLAHLKADHADIVLATYPSCKTVEPHFHETANCGVITQGEMILTIEGAEQRYGPGQWYFIPAGATHWSRFEQETRSVEFYFTAAAL